MSKNPEKIKNMLIDILERGSVPRLLIFLRKIAIIDIRIAERLVIEHLPRIIDFVIRGIGGSEIGDIGELLCVLKAINMDGAYKLANEIIGKACHLIFEKMEAGSLEEIGRVISGIYCVGVNEGWFINKCLNIIKSKMMNSGMYSVGKFLLCLGLVDRSHARKILGEIQGNIERLFNESIHDVSLNDIESLIDGLNVVDKEFAKKFVMEHSPELRGVFTKRLYESSVEDVTKFIMTLSQISVEVARTIFEENIDNLRNRFGERIEGIRRFIKEI